MNLYLTFNHVLPSQRGKCAMEAFNLSRVCEIFNDKAVAATGILFREVIKKLK